jgi:hypothetical protein
MTITTIEDMHRAVDALLTEIDQIPATAEVQVEMAILGIARMLGSIGGKRAVIAGAYKPSSEHAAKWARETLRVIDAALDAPKAPPIDVTMINAREGMADAAGVFRVMGELELQLVRLGVTNNGMCVNVLSYMIAGYVIEMSAPGERTATAKQIGKTLTQHILPAMVTFHEARRAWRAAGMN